MLAIYNRRKSKIIYNTQNFSPLSLFTQGEQGAWYDPSDITTLFQDSAGTTLVTSVGQPVGRMLDKSGRGNHASQTTAANRPVYQVDGNGKSYLAFNGTNSSLSAAAINFTATDKMTVFAGVRQIGAARGVLVALGGAPQPNTPGYFSLEAPGFTNNCFVATVSGTASNIDALSAVLFAPFTKVVAAIYDLGQTQRAGIIKLRQNGIETVPTVGTPLVQVFGNLTLYIGSNKNSSFFLNGNIYSLIIRGAASSASQISQTETYVNSKTGAY